MSGLFIQKKEPSETIERQIANLVDNFPRNVFQALNKHLNETGYCMTIDVLPETNDNKD